MPLPAGTSVPPLPYTVGLLLASAGVTYALYRSEASLGEREVIALSPWMVTGASVYVLFQIDALPPTITPLCSSPAVYVSTFVLAGLVWLLALHHESTATILAIAGGVVSLPPIIVALGFGAHQGTLAPGWPLLGLILSIILAWLTWTAFGRLKPATVSVIGPAGFLAVFGHVLDGITTAIGVDVLSFVELTPLSIFIMDVAAALPIADVVGVGWLFVLVKLLVSVLVVWLVADSIHEEPRHAYLLLLVIIAVGLGPGVHNLLLFTVS